MRRLVEREINDDPPLLGLVLERVERLLAHVGVLHLAFAVGAAPAKAVTIEELLGVFLRQTELLEQQFADFSPSIAVVVLRLRLLNDAVGINVRQLKRD